MTVCKQRKQVSEEGMKHGSSREDGMRGQKSVSFFLHFCTFPPFACVSLSPSLPLRSFPVFPSPSVASFHRSCWRRKEEEQAMAVLGDKKSLFPLAFLLCFRSFGERQQQQRQRGAAQAD